MKVFLTNGVYAIDLGGCHSMVFEPHAYVDEVKVSILDNSLKVCATYVSGSTFQMALLCAVDAEGACEGFRRLRVALG